jgi:hypothetical protein
MSTTVYADGTSRGLRGEPVPSRRTLSTGILPSARSMLARSRHPCLHSPATPARSARAHPSRIRIPRADAIKAPRRGPGRTAGRWMRSAGAGGDMLESGGFCYRMLVWPIATHSGGAKIPRLLRVPPTRPLPIKAPRREPGGLRAVGRSRPHRQENWWTGRPRAVTMRGLNRGAFAGLPAGVAVARQTFSSEHAWSS